ncbi:MAG: DNA-binding transcriptional regulator [Betaproteobacteria bacterium]|nr:MAG: DNA-binding transcriptional regulator [Betaproteobacteria bacterium]
MLMRAFASLFACLLDGMPICMNQTERYYRIDQLINERGLVSFADLMRELEVSRATLKRDLAHLRERLNAPIVFDRDAGGYRYDKHAVGPRFQLPGLWFSADECLALMTMHQMLDALDAGGLLGPHIKPLTERLSKALGSDAAPAKEVLKRVKLLPSQQRRVALKWFELVGKALMTRRRLEIDYFTRYKNEHSRREVSPQRLVHYRGNWYLDAWCYKSEGVRMFSLDSIENARLLDVKAKEVSLKQVDEETARGYGIYRGTKLQWATLVFSPEAARWVRSEIWHDQQQGRELPDGRYELKVPYADSRELEMDVLRHGENVEVVEPPELKRRIGERLRAAVTRYA